MGDHFDRSLGGRRDAGGAVGGDDVDVSDADGVGSWRRARFFSRGQLSASSYRPSKNIATLVLSMRL